MDTAIYLQYEVEDAINQCKCISGVTTDFSASPVYPGTYRVYKVEFPYCPQEPCPDYALIPMHVGEVTISDPSSNDTYMVERTGNTCKTEPCDYLRVINLNTGDTALVAGALAKWILPGEDPGGFFVTILIGVAGGMLGGYIGTSLGVGTVSGFNLMSLLLAIGGAMLLLFAFRLVKK